MRPWLMTTAGSCAERKTPPGVAGLAGRHRRVHLGSRARPGLTGAVRGIGGGVPTGSSRCRGRQRRSLGVRGVPIQQVRGAKHAPGSPDVDHQGVVGAADPGQHRVPARVAGKRHRRDTGLADTEPARRAEHATRRPHAGFDGARPPFAAIPRDHRPTVAVDRDSRREGVVYRFCCWVAAAEMTAAGRKCPGARVAPSPRRALRPSTQAHRSAPYASAADHAERRSPRPPDADIATAGVSAGTPAGEIVFARLSPRRLTGRSL